MVISGCRLRRRIIEISRNVHACRNAGFCKYNIICTCHGSRNHIMVLLRQELFQKLAEPRCISCSHSHCYFFRLVNGCQLEVDAGFCLAAPLRMLPNDCRCPGTIIKETVFSAILLCTICQKQNRAFRLIAGFNHCFCNGHHGAKRRCIVKKAVPESIVMSIENDQGVFVLSLDFPIDVMGFCRSCPDI